MHESQEILNMIFVSGHQSAEVVAFIHSRGVKLVAAPEVAES